ncbi:fimbrial protein [Pseudomonas putida]|uniref:fimbrial protein n=1 Tax=Pseudomonas putida TaxID=303 RepID=UPI003F4ACD4A
MKRILTLFALGLSCSSVMANTGVIEFEGSVSTGGTCPIDVVTPGAGALPKISMGNFRIKDFTGVGDKTQLEKFALRIDNSICGLGADSTATVKFNANYGTDPSGTLYSLQSGRGYSAGLALAIYDKNGTQIPPGTDSVEYQNVEREDMNFSARLHTIAHPVTEGRIWTSVNFVVAIP